MWRKVFRILSNKYLLAFLAFAVWMIFFDQNSLMRRWELKRTLQNHEKDNQYYRDEIKKDSLAIHQMLTDSNSLIKFGREKYKLKKENEDIYIIEIE